jgi:hypothetical protein
MKNKKTPQAPLVDAQVIRALRLRTDLRVGGGDTPAPAPTGPVRPQGPPPKRAS